MSGNNGKDRKYGRRVRMYREDYLSVCIYLNVTSDGSKFYDTVIYRKIKAPGGFEYKRGANLKPRDIPILLKLLAEAEVFLQAVCAGEPDSSGTSLMSL